MIYNNCNINSLLLHRKVRLIIPNTTLAAPAAFAHCLLDFIVLSIITPKSLSSSTSEPQKLWVVQKWHGHFLLPCQVWWASCVARRLQTKKGDFFLFFFYRCCISSVVQNGFIYTHGATHFSHIHEMWHGENRPSAPRCQISR